MRPPSGNRAARIALALVACLAAQPRPGVAAPRRDDAATESLRRQATLLRRELELAAGDEFYLRLDAGTGHLALMLKGVVLDDYPLASLEVAYPRVLFVPRRPVEDWKLRPASAGRLQPARERDRIEVVASEPAPDASPSPPPIPPTAEESYSVPSRYRVEFAEGLSLEVGAPGAGRNRSWLRKALDRLQLRWQDLRAALSRAAADRVRLRVELSADDAAALYRSLPPEVRLLVVGLPEP